MKPLFGDIAGNRRICEGFGKDILASTLSHAYILEGAAGTGKHMLAYRIAAALACENRNNDAHPLPCMQCRACRKILEGNSPDVILLGRGDKATFGVETVRGLKSDVYIPPNDLDVKVYILEDAHLMTSQAQNAFLLTLEEPPAYVLFLLLCESVEPLLETVRSRAPVRRMERLDTEEIRNYLCKTLPEASLMAKNDPHAFAELLVAADGSIGRAQRLLDPNRRRPVEEQRENVRRFLQLAASGRKATDALLFLRGLPTKREPLIPQMNELLLALRDLLITKQSEVAPLCFFPDREEAETLAYRFTTPELLSLSLRVTEALHALRANANVRLTMLHLASVCGLLP